MRAYTSVERIGRLSVLEVDASPSPSPSRDEPEDYFLLRPAARRRTDTQNAATRSDGVHPFDFRFCSGCPSPFYHVDALFAVRPSTDLPESVVSGLPILTGQVTFQVGLNPMYINRQLKRYLPW